ncbi:MAG: SpaA isopeptide-forming pilin-related protein [Lachnospira sp.]
MKGRKKLAGFMAVVLTAMLILPVTTVAKAAVTSTNSITINGVNTGTAHTFELYQIMTGEYKAGEVSDMHWGTGVTQYRTESGENVTITSGNVVDPVVLNEIAETADTSVAKKALIERFTLSSTKTEKASTAGTVSFTNLTTGYYLIKDVTTGIGADDAVSGDILVYVSGSVAVNVKSAKPAFDKLVSKDGSTWAEVVDSKIGDTVKYKLKVSIPATTDFSAYETYKLIFNDVYPTGVTYKNIDSVTYTVESGEANTIQPYDAESNANGYKLDQIPADEESGTKAGLKVGFDNLIATVGSENWSKAITLEVVYSATLNDTASSITGTTNESYESGKVSAGGGYITYSNNPAAPETVGQTAVDTVGVFTFRVESTKYANLATSGYELNGAKFTLHKDTEDGEAVPVIYDAAINAYRPVVGEEVAVGNMVSGYGSAVEANNGKLDIAGLSAGTYVLVEDEAPDGYTKITPLTFTISVVLAEASNGTAADATVSLTGISSLTGNSIIDTLTSNSQLPSTGGIGTTIFYIVGSLMVVGAGVILITRKRLYLN